eukprot:2152758-Pyramimonas_sp.AAC.1
MYLEPHVLVLLDQLHNVAGRGEETARAVKDLGLKLGDPRQHEGHRVHPQPVDLSAERPEDGLILLAQRVGRTMAPVVCWTHFLNFVGVGPLV